jgi:hypothetical protein
LPIDPTLLVPSRDSFVVRIQGAPFGTISSSMEKTPTGFHYSERSSIGGFVKQTTSVDLDQSGAVTRVRQNGKVQGQATSIEVDYANGRAVGKASTVSPEGPRSVAVDTTVAAGTVDDNAVQPLLVALPWAANASWSFGVFSSGQNEYRVTTLKVVGIETVGLDSGPVEAYKVDWSGGWQPATFWISTAAPHWVFKIPSGCLTIPRRVLRRANEATGSCHRPGRRADGGFGSNAAGRRAFYRHLEFRPSPVPLHLCPSR